jgi:hypothetical protein
MTQSTQAQWDNLLILGALDSLGVALAEHDHQWTDGEKAIYEESVKLLTKEIKL